MDQKAMNKLIGLFVSTAEERLTETSEAIGNLTSVDGQEEAIKKIGRDFHTIKGESRLLGLGEIERLSHVSEDVLFGHQKRDTIGQRTQELLLEAIDMIFTCAQSRGSNEPVPTGEVDELIERLKAEIDAEIDAEGEPQQDEKKKTVSPPEPRLAEDPPPPPEVQPGPTPESELRDLTAEDVPDQDRDTPEPVAPEPTASEPPQAQQPAAVPTEKVIHISSSLLDQITDLVSDVSSGLVRNRQYLNQLLELSEQLRQEMKELEAVGNAPASSSLEEGIANLSQIIRSFREHGFKLDLTYSDLSDKVRTSRLQPLKTIFVRYPPFVRRCAREANKPIALTVTGGDVGIEQRVLEEIAEPCLHLLRNSVVHGIEDTDVRLQAGKPETGSIAIRAQQDGDLIRIEFADDGRGIDHRRVLRRALAMGMVTQERAEQLDQGQIANLIFSPGLSTASEATELAGRGVGLDAVAAVIDKLGGSITIKTEAGRGTRFILQVPVSLSLTHVLLLEACNQIFAIPNAAIVEVFRLQVRDIQRIEGMETTRFRGQLLPLVRLREVLGLRGIKDIFVNKVGVIVLRAGEDIAGFIIDSFAGEREIVARPFGPYLGRPSMVSGFTLMENGDVVLILHAPDLLRSVREAGKKFSRPSTEGGEAESAHRILYVEDSVITREYAAGVLRTRGYAVTEAGDGIEALEVLKEQSFDMILTDLQMPRMDGFKLTAALRKRPETRNLPIVVLSTIESPEPRKMALDAGADVYLVKSEFSAELLLSTIQQVLG